jgi:hypothetical protein
MYLSAEFQGAKYACGNSVPLDHLQHSILVLRYYLIIWMVGQISCHSKIWNSREGETGCGKDKEQGY